MMRAAIAVVALLAVAGPSVAIMPCPLWDPYSTPSHPGAADIVDVRLDAPLLVSFTQPPLANAVLRKVTALPDGTTQVDVVFTTKPDGFVGFDVVTDIWDEPVARLGPLTLGTHAVSVSLQLDVMLLPGCPNPKTLAIEVAGTPGPTLAVAVVEYYNAKLDHYFITQEEQEIADLDNGVHPGWKRTGKSFLAYRPGKSDGRGASVRRYYGLPEHGLDTHFFTPSIVESGQFERSSYFADWQRETVNAFELALPDPDTGGCLPGTQPIYRLWNQRVDSNHRYTTDLATKAEMIAVGYVAEGYGADAVAMCAPL